MVSRNALPLNAQSENNLAKIIPNIKTITTEIDAIFIDKEMGDQKSFGNKLINPIH
ncbi:hypothetical protein [Neobacillus niacini]|uniref:hypothetical protein n=1 Tax=Neobacillus niacini TaxID=86668 RepID=UPI00285517E3|nr:hypothetical protein [Neobacillus niacini]MDR6998279.1 hypothetical protein [Neobacillus niacini]